VTTESISAGHGRLQSPFSVGVKLAPDAVVIEVVGALDGRARRLLEASFASARNAERRGVVVDLTGLASCDELAAQVLADEVRFCLDCGAHVEIAGKGDRAAS
jgi:anti-anti-sigma regulatory factor